MTKVTSELLHRALELPRADRARLVRELIASLDQEDSGDSREVDQAWSGEIARRVRDLDAGRARTVSGDKVLARLRAGQERDEGKAV